jgi:hypothetical protein
VISGGGKNVKKEALEYLQNVLRFLALDIQDEKKLIKAVNENEPPSRVEYDSKTREFKLGMAKWSLERVQKTLCDVQQAVRAALDCSLQNNGKISEDVLKQIHEVSHDLKIQHMPDPAYPNGMRLGYIVPDSKIAWEEGKCPHCGETVRIHLFPDPIPILAYEAIINTLRLLTRQIPIEKDKKGQFCIGEIKE